MVESLLKGEINGFGKMGLSNQGKVVIAFSYLYSRVYSIIFSAVFWIKLSMLEKIPKPQLVLTEFHLGYT